MKLTAVSCHGQQGMLGGHGGHLVVVNVTVDAELVHQLHAVGVPYLDLLIPAGGAEESCISWVPLNTFNLARRDKSHIYRCRREQTWHTRCWIRNRDWTSLVWLV